MILSDEKERRDDSNELMAFIDIRCATVPDVVVSATNTAAGSAPGAQQQTGAGVQRVSSIASIASMPNGHASVNINAGGSNTMNLGPLSWNPSLGRDPRGRAKSREYLKQ